MVGAVKYIVLSKCNKRNCSKYVGCRYLYTTWLYE